jgi:hypothetical protein
MTDVKISQPPTPALREAHPSLPADAFSEAPHETTRELSVEITQGAIVEGPPSSTTPADSAPPERTPAETPRELAAIAEAHEPLAEQPALQFTETIVVTETQPNVLGIQVSAPGGLELDITPEAPAESANDTNGDAGWGSIDDSWGAPKKKNTKSANSTSGWGSSGGGASVGWGSTPPPKTTNTTWGAKPSSWSMPAAPSFGGFGSTIAGSLGGILGSDGRNSPRASPLPVQSSLPGERPLSIGGLGGLGSSLAGSLSNLLISDDKKSVASSPRPNSTSLPAAQSPAHVETALVDAPAAAPAQTEEPTLTEAPLAAAAAEEDTPIPVAAPAADKSPEETAPADPPAAAPGETGDGEGNDGDDKEDEEKADAKKPKAAAMKQTNSKGGGKGKKKKK